MTANKERHKMFTNVDKQDDNIIGNNETEYNRGEHPNSLANLKPFPKGVSGNPLGRPHKYQKLADTLNKIGDKEVVDYKGIPGGYSYREGVLEKVWKKAHHGDIKFIQLFSYTPHVVYFNFFKSFIYFFWIC